jgi:hypothetical protein
MATDTTSQGPWESLTPDQKLQKRLDAWLSPPGINFAFPEAQAAYKERVTNMIDSLTLRKRPARVPLMPGLGAFAETYCGYTHRDVMYDVDKSIEVMNKCTLEVQLDTKVNVASAPGQAWEAVDFTLYSWPSHGLPDDADGTQFIEGEYMGPEEYDAFIADPTRYWGETYLPRIMKTLVPLQKLGWPLVGTGATSSIPMSMAPWGLPDVQEALAKMMEAGRSIQNWNQKLGAANRRLTELGYPSTGGGTSKAPFDLIGDSLRGTRGIIVDMFKRPQKLIDAMERLVPDLIKMGVQTARMGDCPTVGFALHKGADGFMSDAQFKEFYWPTLRKICIGLIEEGLIPRLGAQGGYNSRLEVIRDLPRGKTLWAFGNTMDMDRAKEVMGDVACISGNVPAALVHAGTPDEIIAYCKHLIDVVGKGGGYWFSTSAGVNRTTKEENVRAMINFVKEYGVYK